MKVYQLELKGVENLLLDVVFANRIEANKFKRKYKDRKFNIIEREVLDYQMNNEVYRVCLYEGNEYQLDCNVFGSLNSVNDYINNNSLNNVKVIRENVMNSYTNKCNIVEV